MLKFVVLSVLAISCAAESLYGSNLGYGFHGLGGGFRNFMGGYGSGYYGAGGYGSGGYGSGLSRFSGYGYGGRTLGAGERVGMTSYGSGLSSGLSGGLNGYYYLPQYRFGGMNQQYQQPIVSSSYIQPYTTGLVSGVNTAGMFASRNLNVAQSVKPAVSFLTQHHSEPHQEVVQAAITQLGRTVEYKSMPYQEQPMQAQIVEVEPSETPLHIHFKTKSSSVSLSQAHQQTPAQEAQLAQTQDEPARLIHEIQKPIIQEVREVITPYRQVTQEIQPVVEAVHTVVTKAEGQRQQYVANTQFQPTSYANMAVDQRHLVSAQPIATQSVAVSAQPIASTFSVQPIASTVAVQPASSVAVQPVVYGYESSSVAQPIYGGYGYSSIAQPVVSGSSIVSPIRGSSFSHDGGMIHSGIGYETISHPVSSSSVITTSQPTFSGFTGVSGASGVSGVSTGVSGVSGSSSSIRSDDRVVSESRRAY